MKANRVLICLFTIIACSNVEPVYAQKDTIKIGVFIESIYDINFATYSYNTNFWMWCNAQGDLNDDGKIDSEDSLAAVDRIKLLALTNAKDYTYSNQMASKTTSGGKTYWWVTQFCRASIYQEWQLHDFPFDRQPLRLKFENAAFDTTQAIMLHEQDSMKFKNDINLIGWRIRQSDIQSSIVKYMSDFGDPVGNGTSYYSRVTFFIELERLQAEEYFIKLCLGAFVAFLVAMLAFAISPPAMESRFGLGVGALFAVVANKYVVDMSIPDNATNSLVDKIHELTFVYIFITIVAAVGSLILHNRGKHLIRRRFDVIVSICVLMTYVLIVGFHLLRAGR